MVYVALFVLLRDRRFVELFALAALFSLGSARSLLLVRRGKGSEAAIFWSCVTIPIVIAASVVVPVLFPSLIMMTLVAGSLLISFVSGWRLRAMLALNLGATSFIVAVGVLSPRDAGLPLWAARVLVLATVPMTTGLILVILAQFAGRLRAVNERLERRASEKARDLVRTEARMGALIESAMDGIVTINADGWITEFNSAAERMFGKSRSDDFGEDVAEATISPALREAGALEARLVIGQGPMLQRPTELLGIRPDGTDFAVEASITQIDRSGPAPMYTAFIRDITERKKIEAALKQSEHRFFQFAEQMPLGVYVVDSEGRSVFMNGAATAMLGLPLDLGSSAEALPDTYQAYVAGTDQLYPGERTPLVRALRGERHVRVDDMEIRRPDGTIPVEVVASPILNQAGAVEYAIAVFMDLTEHNLAEAELRQAAEDLELARGQADAANHAKSEFLSRMSHELRTPLTAILGFAQLLEIDNLSPQQLQSVGYVLKAGKHLLGLINEVLDIAQIESGHLSLSIEPVALRGVVIEILDLVGPMAAHRNITLEVGTFDHERAVVLADRQRLNQVVLNLISNAIKYNEPGGSVRVSSSRVIEGAFRVAVTDTGPGIPEEALPRLFTAFDRIGAEQTEIEGTGLGLSLSKVLVETMGGTIGVETAVGKGSNFWFQLPGAPMAAGHDEVVVLRLGDVVETPPFCPPPTIEPRESMPSRKLLYIEDSPSNQRLVEMLLTHRPGIDLLSAIRGRIGLELARQTHPDLILLDLQLPEMQGGEVLAALRTHQSTAQIPVVILTADSSPGLFESLRDAGANDCLMKPLDLAQLLALIDRYTVFPREAALHIAKDPHH